MEYILEYLSLDASAYIFAGVLIAETQALFFLFAALASATYKGPRIWLLFFLSNSAIALLLVAAFLVVPH